MFMSFGKHCFGVLMGYSCNALNAFGRKDKRELRIVETREGYSSSRVID